MKKNILVLSYVSLLVSCGGTNNTASSVSIGDVQLASGDIVCTYEKVACTDSKMISVEWKNLDSNALEATSLLLTVSAANNETKTELTPADGQQFLTIARGSLTGPRDLSPGDPVLTVNELPVISQDSQPFTLNGSLSIRSAFDVPGFEGDTLTISEQIITFSCNVTPTSAVAKVACPNID